MTPSPGTHFMRAILLAGAIASSGACAAAGRDGEASAFLIIDSLQASTGAKPTEFKGALASDVLTVIDGSPTILEDLARATFRLAMKDPTGAGPSPINFVTLRGYRVTFTRADGRNTQGVDVPYAFDGAITATVGNSVVSVPLVLVRAQAKLEAPLRALVGGGGAISIASFADIVFYGTDQAGRDVTVSARISVTFADWGDEE